MKLTPINRTGVTISSETRDAIHEARDCSHNAHRQLADLCGCDECNAHAEALDKLYVDHDDAAPGGPLGDRSQSGVIERNNESVQSVLDRLQAAGLLNSSEAQVAAAALTVRKMYNNKV
jgi:hypothetical protein